MLPRQNRLPARTKLNHPSIYRSRYFLVKSAEHGLAVSRFAFVVRKTIEKSAVRRNRARRVIRSCIEEMLPRIKNGVDMLFILEKSIIGLKRDEVCGEIERFLKEKQLLNKEGKNQK